MRCVGRDNKEQGRKAPPWRATPSAPSDHAVPERRSRQTQPTAVARVGSMVVVVAPSGRAYQPYLLAVFLALFFFLAVFLAALRFFAMKDTSFLNEILHGRCTLCQRKFSRRGVEDRLLAPVCAVGAPYFAEGQRATPQVGTDHVRLRDDRVDERAAAARDDAGSR